MQRRLRNIVKRDFLNYLFSKKAIIVGPSAVMEGSNKGKFIDSFDLVCRVNLASPVPEQMYSDIGSRTDILCHTIVRERHIVARPDIFKAHSQQDVDNWINDGVKYILLKEDESHEHVADFVTLLDNRIPYVVMDSDFMALLHKQMDCVPNTGILFMAYMLRTPVKRLHVIGFDFYARGYYTGYGGFTKQQAEAGRRDELGRMRPAWGQTGKPGMSKTHNLQAQLKHLKKLTRNPKLKLDDNLEEALKTLTKV